MNKEIALNNLVDIRDTLDQLKINYFLAYGTCLGAVREKDFIGHDLDTDIGIMDEDFNFKLFWELARVGFQVKYIFGMRHLGFEIALTRNGVKTDIMLFYKKGDKVWTALWNNGGKNGMSDIIKTVYNADLFIGRKVIQLNGIDFKVLEKAEEYVATQYGADWKTPTKNWNWRISSPAISEDFII